MAVSAVPVYQQVARRIGTERMQKYLDAFQYGNREIGPVIDRFWLDGPLRISALEQIEFFDKLRRGGLPVSARSLDIVREIITAEAVSGGAIRTKTAVRLASMVRRAKGVTRLACRLCRSRRRFIGLRDEYRYRRPCRSRAPHGGQQNRFWVSSGRSEDRHSGDRVAGGRRGAHRSYPGSFASMRARVPDSRKLVRCPE